MTGSPIFFSNLRNRRNASNWNYGMSIKNCQAIQKSSLDRESNAWITLGSESESHGSWHLKNFWVDCCSRPLKPRNDRQSDIFLKFKESKEHIQFKLCPLWYVHYVHKQVLSDPKTCLFSICTRVCSIVVRSWHPSRDILTIFCQAWPSQI